MPFDARVIPNFGGGLHFADNPATINDNEWTWCDGWVPKRGTAETAWSYQQIGAQFLSGSQTVIGALPNHFDPTNPLLVVWRDGTLSPAQGKLSTSSPTGTLTAITWDTVGNAPVARANCLVQETFINGFFIYNLGASAGAGVGVIQWDGLGATFSTIAGLPAGFGVEFLTGFGARVIAAGDQLNQTGYRTARWTDANTQVTWAPAISNSADIVFLDDSTAPVTALLPVSDNAIGVFTRANVYTLTPTGSIPAFTRSQAGRFGCQDSSLSATSLPDNHSQLGWTPYGVVYRSGDDFRVFPGTQGLGKGMHDFYHAHEMASLVTAQTQWLTQFHWHRTRRLLLVPANASAALPFTPEFLCFDPEYNAWGRVTGPSISTVVARHTITRDGSTTVLPVDRHYYVDVFGARLRETDVPKTNAFVDTKDFTFGTPPFEVYIQAIKIDWEPLTSGTNDQLTVLALARNDLSLGTQGSAGMNEDLTSQFVSQGVLTGGQSELPVNLRGKFIRFRFQITTGTARIRGFTILYRRAGTRRTGTNT